MNNQELFGAVLPNIYIDKITIKNVNLLSYSITVDYSIYEPTGNDQLSWASLPTEILNNIKIAFITLKDSQTTSNSLFDIKTNKNNIRSKDKEDSIQTFLSKNPEPALVSGLKNLDQKITTSAASTAELSNISSELLKKYVTSQVITLPNKPAIQNLDLYAVVYYVAPSNIYEIYGNFTKISLIRSGTLSPQKLIFVDKATNIQFLGQTEITSNGIIEYNNPNKLLLENYVPLTFDTNSANNPAILDSRVPQAFQAITINTPRNPFTKSSNNPYFSNPFISINYNTVPTDGFNSTFFLEGYVFFDHNRFYRDSCLIPTYFINNNLSDDDIKNISFNIYYVDTVNSNNTIECKTVAEKVIINNKEVLKIKFITKNSNIFTNNTNKSPYDLKISVSSKDLTKTYWDSYFNEVSSKNNALISLSNSATFIIAGKDDNDTKVKKIQDTFDKSVALTRENLKSYFTVFGFDIKQAVADSSVGTYEDLLDYLYDSVKIVNLSTIVDNINGLRLLLKSTVLPFYNNLNVASKPATLTTDKKFDKVFDFSVKTKPYVIYDTNTYSNKILFQDKLKTFNDIFSASLPFDKNSTNNYLATATANTNNYNFFVSNYINIFSNSLPDKNTVPQGSRELPIPYNLRLMNLSLSVTDPKNTKIPYLNFVLNLNKSNKFLTGFNIVADKDFLDLNSPIWVDDPSQKTVYLKKLTNVNYKNYIDYYSEGNPSYKYLDLNSYYNILREYSYP